MQLHLTPVLGEAVAIDGDALLLVLVGIIVLAVLALAAIGALVWAAVAVGREVWARRSGRRRV